MVRIRKNLISLTNDEKNALLEAIGKLHNIDNDYVPIVQLHNWTKWGLGGAPSSYPDQGHQFPGFLPWHRIVLLEIERRLQEIDPHVSLAYWVQSEDLDNGGKETIFTPEFLGVTPNGGCQTFGDVKFGTDNPLFGWKMEPSSWWSTPDNPAPAQRTEPVKRYLTSCSQPDFDRSSELLKRGNYTDFSNGGGVEGNPHNIGHNSIGGWMLSATSPRDPVFQLFHSYHDMIWAKWQWQYGRFYKGSDISDAKVFSPNNKFDPNNNQGIPKGHHLLDEMWPWNGEQGSVSPPCNFANQCLERHPPKKEAEFQASVLPDTWPGINTTGTPTPKDAIAYQGMEDGVLDMGFAYDDVPYGVDPKLTSAARIATASAVTMSKEVMLKEARSSMKDKNKTDSERTQALDHTREADRNLALDHAVKLLSDSQDGSEQVDSHAISTLRLLAMTTEGQQRMGDIKDAVRSVMTDERSSVRKAAAHFLGSMHDPEAVAILKEDLAKSGDSLFTKEEVLLLLSMSGDEHAEDMRPFLEADDPQHRAAAVSALATDPHSQKALLRIMSNKKEATEVRTAAVEVLMSSDDPEFLDAVWAIVNDADADLALHKHAIAGIGFFVRTNRASLSEQEIVKTNDKLAALSSGKQAALGKTHKRAVKNIRHSLKHKLN
ncbi:MAG: tyrosinase family protein [Arenicella sp.]|nr:tyrosinase family protein [Arenicella sp.]